MLGLSPDQQAFLVKAGTTAGVLLYVMLTAWLYRNKHRLVLLSHSLYL